MSERLTAWAKHHINHRDIFYKKLLSFEDTENGFIAHFKDKDVHYIISENLDFEGLQKEEEQFYVTLNNTKNFKTLLAEWKILVAYEKLKIMFVEKVSSGEHWQIAPFMHDKIADKKTLKSGLKSLYESVRN